MAGLSWVQGSGERLERRPLLDPGAGARQREPGPFDRGRGAAQTACIVVDRIKFIIAQQREKSEGFPPKGPERGEKMRPLLDEREKRG